MRRAILLGFGTWLASCGAEVTVESAGDSTPAATRKIGCQDPVPVAQLSGEPSGFVECADGFIHRVERVTCAQPVEEAGCKWSEPSDPSACTDDDDCTARPYGRCGSAEFWPSQSCECHYGCASDDDCGPGSICACAGVVGERSRCITAACSDGASCGEGLCGLYRRQQACGEWSARTACMSGAAPCRIDADCQQEPMECTTVSFAEIDACVVTDGAWICGYEGCGPCG